MTTIAVNKSIFLKLKIHFDVWHHCQCTGPALTPSMTTMQTLAYLHFYTTLTPVTAHITCRQQWLRLIIMSEGATHDMASATSDAPMSARVLERLLFLSIFFSDVTKEGTEERTHTWQLPLKWTMHLEKMAIYQKQMRCHRSGQHPGPASSTGLLFVTPNEQNSGQNKEHCEDSLSN